MRILLATDAWRPQVNGVVRTLENMTQAAAALGASFEFLTPEAFPTFPLPTYAEIPVAIPNFADNVCNNIAIRLLTRMTHNSV